jgi:hypothetical protein
MGPTHEPESKNLRHPRLLHPTSSHSLRFSPTILSPYTLPRHQSHCRIHRGDTVADGLRNHVFYVYESGPVSAPIRSGHAHHKLPEHVEIWQCVGTRTRETPQQHDSQQTTTQLLAIGRVSDAVDTVPERKQKYPPGLLCSRRFVCHSNRICVHDSGESVFYVATHSRP